MLSWGANQGMVKPSRFLSTRWFWHPLSLVDDYPSQQRPALFLPGELWIIMAMNFFDIAGILVALAAAFAFINHKLLKLPTTVGLMLLAMLHAVARC